MQRKQMDMDIATDPPLREQCLELFDKCGMLENIRCHSLKVCEVSMTIASALLKAGVEIDISLVEAGALLHDITKTESLGGLTGKENHAKTGKRLLIELGYPKTAEIVGEHIIPNDRGDLLTPAEIVAYADKRVLHDRIVSLYKRFDYLLERYSHAEKAAEYYEIMRQKMLNIESLIEKFTGKAIEDLLSVNSTD